MQSLPSAYLPMAQEIKKEKAYSLLKTKKGGGRQLPKKIIEKGKRVVLFSKEGGNFFFM